MTASANNVTVPGDTRLNDLKISRESSVLDQDSHHQGASRSGRLAENMLITGLLLTALLLVALFAPVIAPYGYAQLKDANGVSFPAQRAPSSEHIWGTTAGGYDVFSRVIWGSCTAVIAIVIAVLLSIFAGVLLGLVSRIFRWLGGSCACHDRRRHRFLPLAAACDSDGHYDFRRSVWSVEWHSRVGYLHHRGLYSAVFPYHSIRGHSNEGIAYVDSARVVGASTWRIMTKHLLKELHQNVTGYFNVELVRSDSDSCGIGLPRIRHRAYRSR